MSSNVSCWSGRNRSWNPDNLIKSLEIVPTLRVLDLSCGDGTTAVPLAQLGAEVFGIDIARNLVEAGNKRAAEAGLNRLKVRSGVGFISFWPDWRRATEVFPPGQD
jgi:2-polyprenyl-3-methyl-5-hydroxy-6-metoxy-1,4-benzoquinol methylase